MGAADRFWSNCAMMQQQCRLAIVTGWRCYTNCSSEDIALRLCLLKSTTQLQWGTPPGASAAATPEKVDVEAALQ
jgi:hypothetical protein